MSTRQIRSLLQGPPRPAPEPLRDEPPLPGFRAARVLLAEADPDTRAAMAASLRAIGYEVQAVATGDALVDVLAARALYDPQLGADLIITGVPIPELAGLALLDDLRLLGWSSPVIVLLDRGDRALARDASAVENLHLLARPFELGDLLDMARRAMPARIPVAPGPVPVRRARIRGSSPD